MSVSPELAFASIRTLAKGLREKQFSSVELTEFFLQRLETLGPKFNAVVTVTSRLAREQAAIADKELQSGKDRGPLHGIPYGAKDLLATRGIPTSWGADPYKNRVFDEDATVIIRLREAGAVLCAKLAMVEIAGGMGYRQANAAFTGPGLNSWDVTRWSGGSSSGSGSAVGAGLVPFAIGSETWGSIMSPAGHCGVAGLRPTYGRVSRHGAMALSWTMDKIGPLCHTADDCGTVLSAISGPDPLDETAVARAWFYPPQEKIAPPFKLVTLKGAVDKVQPEVKANYLAALDVLREFATFEEIELPDMPYSPVASTFIDCEMAAAFEDIVTSGDCWKLTAPEDHAGAHASMVIPAKDYINALRIRRKMQVAIDRQFATFDAVVTPTSSTVAPPVGPNFGDYSRGFTSTQIGAAGNVAGLPAITIPNGFGERGLPTGLQFVSRAFDEHKILAIAAKYQSATKWHEKHPSV